MLQKLLRYQNTSQLIKKIKYLLLFLMIGGSIHAAPFIVRGVVTNNSLPATQKWVRIQFPQGGDTSVTTDFRGEYIVTINPTFRIGTVLTSFSDICGKTVLDTNSFDSLTTLITSNLIGCVQPPSLTLTIKGFIKNLPNQPFPLFLKFSIDQFRTQDSVLVDSMGKYEKTIVANTNGTIEYRLFDCNNGVIQDSAGFRLGDTIPKDFDYCPIPPNSYFGRVSYKGASISTNDAFLLRYSYNTIDQEFDFVDTLYLILNGRFSFPKDSNTDYLLKVIPRSNQQPFVATYYPKGRSWSNQALAIGPHISDTSELFVDLLPKQIGQTGGASVSGKIMLSDELKIPGYHGVGIHLLDKNEVPVDYTYTDSIGQFKFENLVSGNYFVWLDQCGIPTTPFPVTISNNSESVSGIIITGNKLGISYDYFVSNEEQLNGNNVIEAFPNPFAHELKITSRLSAEIAVFNSYGKSILNVRLNENETRMIETETWPTGLYVAYVHSKNKRYSVKLLKK